MHYLVTGGAGFIGTHLTEFLLQQNHQVTILDNLSNSSREFVPEQARLVVGDITDRVLVAELMATVDGCFHLAAIGSVDRCKKDWKLSHQNNVFGTLVVFDAAAKLGVKTVYASSSAVYGDSSEQPLMEKDSPAPISTYGVTKLINEQYAKAFYHEREFSSVGLRIFNVFGPSHQVKDPSTMPVIASFIEALNNGKPITIYGDGKQTRDFVYTGDVVDAFVKAMDARIDRPEIVNVCSGLATSILTIAQQLMKKFNVDKPINFQKARAGDILHSVGSPEKAEKLLGFKAQVALQEGLRTLTALAC